VNAEQIRDFFRTLFGSRLIEHMQAQLIAYGVMHDHVVKLLREDFERERAAMHRSYEQLDRDAGAALGWLKEQLAKTEKERDYFRQRAERLELVVLGRATPPAAREPKREIDLKGLGRKSWQQVQVDHLKHNAELDQQEKAAKAAKEQLNGAEVPESGNAATVRSIA
jgi:hypothetical protein